MSNDGSRIAIGSRGYNSRADAGWVETKELVGGVWTAFGDGATLLVGASANAWYGSSSYRNSVKLSGDGNRLLLAAQGLNLSYIYYLSVGSECRSTRCLW
jgi:hypothetical protein